MKAINCEDRNVYNSGLIFDSVLGSVVPVFYPESINKDGKIYKWLTNVYKFDKRTMDVLGKLCSDKISYIMSNPAISVKWSTDATEYVKENYLGLYVYEGCIG